MIKLIIFDLDGVLVDTKPLHYYALNKALKKIENYEISINDHSNIFDGLPTKEKLNILIKQNKIKKKNIEKIKKIKQSETKNLLKKRIKFSKKIFFIFKKLSPNYKIAIASNAVSETLDICIKKLKIKKFIDYKLSNNDVINSKPHPEIYINCVHHFKFKPSECMIVEDSHYGRTAALESGCNLLPIKRISDLNFKSINHYVKINSEDMKLKQKPWIDSKLNILIPMAGLGSRFAKAGFTFPKPLIEVKNKPMIQWVVESLNITGKYIFIIQKEHQQKFNIKSVLKTLVKGCEIIELDKITEGAACTTLLAEKFINNSNPLIIANSDQYIEWNSSKTMYDFTSKKFDGGILTFKSIHPKWSYAKCIKNSNIVKEVAEKKVISENATAGIYYWSKGSDYVKYSKQMIKNNVRVNNEFYVCPVFNEAIKDKKKITISHIEKMSGLGTPEDLNEFLSNLNFNS